MLGYDAGELGETFAEQAAKIHPDDARAMQVKVDQHLRGETASYRTEFRVLRKDGTYAWFESAAWSSSTAPTGTPANDRDPHRHQRPQGQRAAAARSRGRLRRNRDELQAMVRQQTPEAGRRRRRRGARARAKNALLANLGEEFQTPLDIVTGTSARLLAGQRRGSSGLARTAGADPAGRSPAVRRPAATPRRPQHRDRRTRPVPDPGKPPPRTRGAVRGGGEPGHRAGLDLRTVICDEDLVVFADRARLAQVVRDAAEQRSQVHETRLHTGAHEDVRRDRADRGAGHRRGHCAGAAADAVHAFRSMEDRPSRCSADWGSPVDLPRDRRRDVRNHRREQQGRSWEQVLVHCPAGRQCPDGQPHEH